MPERAVAYPASSWLLACQLILQLEVDTGCE